MTEHPTRTKVLDAVDALIEGGISKVTIDAVSERSGVTNGSIYHHFGSRSGALAAAAARAFRDAMGAAAGALDDRDTEACIRDFVGRYVAWIDRNPGRAALLYQAPLIVDLTDVEETKFAAFAPVLTWIGAREVRPIPIELLDQIVFGPVHESARRWLAGDRTRPLAKLRHLLADAVWSIVQPV